jgi:alkanesulfonate monooxygenase SsuD/methylene tetrahydromethanopterin reductase-like flavin-dependent oxidoreductase (luciferase family)
MEVGIVQVMPAFGYPGMSDAAIYEGELHLAVLADALGFDHVWAVEHHFEDYSFCPDNFVYLAHLAARTERIRLATGAVILPWNTQPLRVAEKASLLDLLSGGRAILGIGRGLSRREFGQFGIGMEESRDRFDESAPMILEALETGVMEEHHGKFFDQPRAVIRPRPSKSFRDRTAQVAMSSDSILEAAKLGVQMMSFVYKTAEQHKADIDSYRAEFRRLHGRDPKPPLLADMLICDSDGARAQENAERYCAGYFHSLMYHYEMAGEHFSKTKGYAEYGVGAEAMRAMGLEDMAKAYAANQIFGTPDQILRKLEERRAFMGDVGSLMVVRFGGAPFEVGERTLKLFAKEVMPVIRGWGAETGASRRAAE